VLELGFARPVGVIEGIEEGEEGVAFVAEIQRLVEHGRILAAARPQPQPLSDRYLRNYRAEKVRRFGALFEAENFR